jgi:hypothetical protein
LILISFCYEGYSEETLEPGELVQENNNSHSLVQQDEDRTSQQKQENREEKDTKKQTPSSDQQKGTYIILCIFIRLLKVITRV